MASGTWSFTGRMMPAPKLELIGLKTKLLPGLDLSLSPGECITLDGPSGVGKSQLLRAIADLDPHEGSIKLNGKDCLEHNSHAWRRLVMYFPSESHWWEDQVAAHATRWSNALLSELGLNEKILEQSVIHLSSGEKQRLALARGLSYSPQVLLLDEPTANLDKQHTLALEEIILRCLKENISVIWVSHDEEQRMRISSRHINVSKQGFSEESYAAG